MTESESLEFVAASVAILLKYTRARAFPPHAALRIDDFVDPMPLWTLETATSAGLVGLLDRMVQYELYVNSDFKLDRYDFGLRNAVKSGQWDALQWWANSYLEDPPPLEYVDVFQEAALHGQVHILQRLRDQGIYTDGRYHGVRIHTTHASVARWMDGGQAMLIDVSLAAAAGDLDFILWVESRWRGLFNVTGDNYSEAGRLAARNGHNELSQWLHIRSGDIDGSVLTGAVEGGHLAIVQWIYDRPRRPTVNHTFEIVDTNLEIINWMMGNFQWSLPTARERYFKASIDKAAALGKLDMLEAYVDADFLSVAHQRNTIMQEAAANGHLHVVEWLYAKGVAVDEMHVASAAGKSQFHVAQWLCDRYSGRWSSNLTHVVVRDGELSGLRWLHARGMTEFSKETMSTAVRHGQFPIVKWIHSNIERSIWWSSGPLYVAVREGHYEIARWLLDNDESQEISFKPPSDGTRLMQLVYGSNVTTVDVYEVLKKGAFALVERLHNYVIDTE